VDQQHPDPWTGRGDPRMGIRHHARPASSRARAAVGAVTALATVGALGILSTGNGSAESRQASVGKPTESQARVAAVEDAFTLPGKPYMRTGTWRVLRAGSTGVESATAYVHFHVDSLPPGARVTRATVVLTSARPAQPRASLTVHPVPDAWSEQTLSDATAPGPGAALDRSEETGRGAEITVDVTPAVRRNGPHAFALRAADGGGAAMLHSRETGRGPALELTWTADGPGLPDPQPSPTTPAPSPTAPAPSGGPTAPPSSTRPPPPSVPSGPGGTLFGASVWRNPGETYAAALARSDRRYGGLDMVRVFYPGAPAPWPGLAGVPNRPVSVSFKLPPAAVAAGAYDALMLAWFRAAPDDRDTYWTYYHEPEDNVKAGEFSAADYRAAWRRLASLADQAGNPRLRSALVLMCFTLQKASGRDWRDYYPGTDVIDVMAWDCYSYASKKGGYIAPEVIFDSVVGLSRSLGKPFAITEFGSAVAVGDDGSGRAAWLRRTGRHLESQGAVFVAYFDSPVNDEYRLLDPASQAAWREFAGR